MLRLRTYCALGVSAHRAGKRGRPRPQSVKWVWFAVTREQFDAMQTVTLAEVKSELLSQEELFLKLAGDLPKEMVFQRELLISRL